MTLAASELRDGLRRLGLGPDSTVQIHASLSSFGPVEGGALTLAEAVLETCGTAMMVAGAWDLTSIPAPPGLVRPNNAYRNAESWPAFDEAVAAAVPYRSNLPVSAWLGTVAETLRRHPAARRGDHPLFSFAAVGRDADLLVDAQKPDDPLGPLRRLSELDGDVVLLGVGHTSNTMIHLAEQTLHRGRFFRYAVGRDGLWVELPNIPGESHGFDGIEPALRSFTIETRIGSCRARRIPARTVLEVAAGLIQDDPGALLCDEDPECRCAAARAQRLEYLATTSRSPGNGPPDR